MSAARNVAVQLCILPFAWMGMLYFMQDTLIYHARRYDSALDTAAWGPRYRIRELHFDVDGVGHQVATLVTPAHGAVRSLYLVFGGNAMVARNWLVVLAPVSKTAAFANTGLVLVDYPGFGSSAGSPTRSSILAASLAALQEAMEAISNDDDELALGAFGHSLGCAVALSVAEAQQAQGFAFRHLALSAPFTSLVDMAQESMFILKVVPKWIMASLTSAHAWDNFLAAEAISGSLAPRVDILHGSHDSIVPFAQGEQLSTALKDMGFQLSFQAADANHNDILSMSSYQAWLVNSIRQASASRKPDDESPLE